MTHTKAINLLKDNIERLELPKISRLEHLENSEPTIYLCGKSSTGKTTFLNALFNMERDELFTSTNISTKTEFRFQYGIDEIITKADGTLINLPGTYGERKDLFKLINKEGNSYRIILNQEVLSNRVIVDIPGVLDYENNDSYFKRMLDEADIVYFFTPCTKKISSSEKFMLGKVSEAGIPIIVLFTMADLTDIDEGITRNTIPQIVQNRLNNCFKGFKVEHHQIISSNDFYKKKNTHGIDLLTKHIANNDKIYKQNAENKRLRRTVLHYTDLIQNELDVLKTDSEIFKNSVIKEIALRYKAKQRELDNENQKIIQRFNSELNWMIKGCKEQILNNIVQEHKPEQTSTSLEKEKKFRANWEEWWIELTKEFEYLEVRNAELPPFPDNLFEQVRINTKLLDNFFDRVRKSDNKNNNKDDDANEKNQTEPQDKSPTNAQNNKKLEDESKKSQSTSNEDWKDLSWTDYLNLAYELGINLGNAKILWNKYNYIKKVEASMDRVKAGLSNQFDKEFQSRSKSLEEESHRELEMKLSQDPTTASQNKYNESLNQLKTI